MARDLSLALPLSIALLLGSWNPVSAESVFDRLTKRLEQEFNLQREKIPGGWLVNTVLFVARPAGVKHMDFASFENFDGEDEQLPRAVEKTVAESLGKDWRPWVRSFSKAGGESTFIFLKPAGNDWELIVATMERNEATLVKMKVNPDRMAEYIHDHHLVGRDTQRD